MAVAWEEFTPVADDPKPDKVDWSQFEPVAEPVKPDWSQFQPVPEPAQEQADNTVSAFRQQSSAQMLSPQIAPPSQKEILAAEQSRIAGQATPTPTKVAAKVASGLEKGMTMPEKAVRGALDFLGFYGALDAALGTGTKYQDYNRGWLEYFNKREQQLSKEDVDLGATGFGYDVAEGVTRAGTELPTQLLGGAAGATRGAAVKGAALTAGAISGLSQYAQDRGAGKGKTESAIYSGLSGAITGLTTAAFGATGVESIFKNEGVKGVGSRILRVLKQAGFEGAEEAVDQFQQDLLERTARQPNKPLGNSVREILLAGSIGSLIGGAASSLAELGGGLQPTTPVPERPETLDAQLNLVQEGTKPAMLVTPGEPMPKIPEGFEILVAGDRGTVIFNPKIVSAEQVRRLVNLGEEGMAQLLGFGATKEQAAATGTAAVLETKVGNVPVQDEVVSPATLPAAVAASKQTAPGGTMELKPPEQVVAERTETTQPKGEYASEITSPTSVPEPEVRPRVGEEAPLRQSGEAATTQATPAETTALEAAQGKLGDTLAQPAKPAEVAGETGTAGAIATPGPPLGPAPTGATPLTPKSQRQIITDIANGLDIPIRFGRLTTTKFGGYFKRIANLIGSKRADDIPIVSHEVGHKLDVTFKLSDDPALRAELDVLGDPTTPGSRSSWTKSKTKKYKTGEGVAEFVRYWLTDPAEAQRVAPNTFTAFERGLNANKDFGDTMRQAQQDIAVWRNSEPQARLRSQISIGENPNKTPYTASQLTRDLVDDLHILRLATLDAAPKGSPLSPSLDPYLLARNLRGSYGMADTFIRSGVADFKTKAVQLGTSLEDALKPIAGRLNDFRDWIVAKRAQELRSQGRESGLVSSDVDAVARKFDADADFQKAFSDVKAWNDALLKYAEDSGLLTAESVAAMRKMNQDYVPFHRVFEVGAGEMSSQQAGGIGMGLNVGKPGSLKGLKGSPRQIVDPLETMVKNAYTIITASEKAAINLAVADLSKLPSMGKWVERVAAPKEHVQVELERIRKELEAAGADLTGVPDDLLLSFFRQSKRAPFGENIIRITRNGKDEFYRLNSDLHDTFKALDLEDTGKLLRMFSAPAQLLRAGVVLEPSFNIANVLRDTFSAAVIGKYGAFPFETTLRGVAAMVSNPKVVAEWAAAGGKSAVEASYFDRAKLQKFLAERISKDLTPAERALIVVRSPLSALRKLTSTFEEATRIGEYRIAYDQLRKGGMPEGEARRQAAFEARDRQDFAKGGAKTKIIRHAAAFWNAALQANVKLLQSFKQRPIRTTLQGLAFITIPKLLEQAINWDDEDYWARKQWERDLFFLIPIGKGKDGHTQFLRIPTPFEVGVIFGTFPGRILQSMREQNAEAMKGFPALMLKQSVPNPTPQAYQVIFEDFLSGKKGWDVWRGRTIVPESLADEPPELQWTEQTSGIAKKAGEVLKFSPMKIDHIIERTTGGMGKLLTGRSVPGQRFVTAPLTVSNQATETFYDRLEAIREDAGRAKAANKPMPPQFAAFTAFERNLSAMRKAIRETSNLKEKTRLQNEMLRDTIEFLKNNPPK